MFQCLSALYYISLMFWFRLSKNDVENMRSAKLQAQRSHNQAALLLEFVARFLVAAMVKMTKTLAACQEAVL